MKFKSMAKPVAMCVAGLAMVVGLSACGGGAFDAEVVAPFDIGVVVGGHPVRGVHIGPGMTQTVVLPVGQSIQLDANEPVVWTLLVGGAAVTGIGATVDYGGVRITQTALTSSRIWIDTDSLLPLGAPLSFFLVATSTIDAAQVAHIQVVLTN